MLNRMRCSMALVWLLWLVTVQFEILEALTSHTRPGCEQGDPPPSTRVNTTSRLASFRAALAEIDGSFQAFIVGSEDAHDSEYPTEYDQRRAYISGFSGSSGTAVVTMSSAALWTDGRYFLEAEQSLDCNWILMRSGLTDTPAIEQWLNSQLLNERSNVGIDKSLISHSSFLSLQKKLAALSQHHSLLPVDSINNPVDRSWTVGRPPQAKNPIHALDLKFAGVSWADKIKALRENITSKGAGAFVVNVLDETAWLFNLRGSDVRFNPFFLSYAIVELDRTRLYILDKDTRLTANPTDPETKVKLAEHLQTSASGTCEPSKAREGTCVEVVEYNPIKVEEDLQLIAQSKQVWITFSASFAVYSAVQNSSLIAKSPLAIDKSVKNKIEREGMQRAYNRDSAALIKFLAFLEKEIKEGRHWTEVTAGAKLDEQRKKLEYNRGLSFETISGYSSNGAIIHYRPLNHTDKKISTDSLYLLDSGGQYLDGTTDVTRTMHYGNPTNYEKECYTRVLMSSINLAMLKWPEGLYGRQIDAVARYQLWDVGLVYRHGTGHGIGAYLSVHEGPGRIRIVQTPSASDEPLRSYQFFSDEPGYYEDGEFGIRLETVVMTSHFQPKYDTAKQLFLEFLPVQLVPFETNLIELSLMNHNQVKWLNEYNAKIRETLLPLLTDDVLATNWVNARIKQISIEPSASSTPTLTISTVLAIVTVLLALH
ncbi:xaa-Pro aminopeptidase 1-like isoform X2 [Physella acuta]|uniref:xaa-Pro aminopeptidase 1-like isoform X2 n=1 Tax=Physella acuta TaxID=109671 RepID=UPI0027DD6C0F|nr:xaa-Pro aminopeptidase 1-like isoform X2 [Physella acuta]